MLKYLLLSAGLCLTWRQGVLLYAQNIHCATDIAYQWSRQQNPSLDAVRLNMEKTAKSRLLQKENLNANPIITIPVVVHVVYNIDSPQQNIPDTAIFSQIDVLNEDFRRLNNDTDDVRAVFDSLSADIGIEFCLATVDPSGNPTTGIIRTATQKKQFEFLSQQQDSVKFTAGGGDDAWPKDNYLNIWTCYMTFFGTPSVLGYSHFPWDTNAATDGTVIQYNALGRPNFPYGVPPGTGRTVTHEVGHWLGLFHTWGNESFFTGCDSSDYVDDTPNQNGQSNFDCNLSANTCSNESPYWSPQNPPDMVENYLDYSSDTCMCMFSNGQKSRMLSFLNTARSSLFNSNGCDTVTATGNRLMKYNIMQISPNPSSGTIHIRVPDKSAAAGKIFITDIFGRNLLEVVTNKNSGNTYTLDISYLPAGYYSVHFTSGGYRWYSPLVFNAENGVRP